MDLDVQAGVLPVEGGDLVPFLLCEDPAGVAFPPLEGSSSPTTMLRFVVRYGMRLQGPDGPDFPELIGWHVSLDADRNLLVDWAAPTGRFLQDVRLTCTPQWRELAERTGAVIVFVGENVLARKPLMAGQLYGHLGAAAADGRLAAGLATYTSRA